MHKVRYEIDPHNRLVIRERVRKKRKRVTRPRETALPYFRKALHGRFRVDKDNLLTYHVKAPVPRDIAVPHQIKLRGTWSLTGDHNLAFTLDKWGRQTFGDQLTLQGDIVDVRRNALLFAVTTRTKEGTRSTSILKLRGTWQADKYNRLTLRVKKERGRYDILTFGGIWEVNRNHQIVYSYEKARLIRKQKKVRTLIFKGHWDIREKGRLSYVLERHSGIFHFRTAFGIFKERYIKYQLGIGLSQRQKPAGRTVILFGTWKIGKKRGLTFEVEYENRRIHAILFGAEARLTDRDTILFKLRNEIHKDINARLEVSRKIVKGNGEAFVRLLASKGEVTIYAGAGFAW
jgi:hypothetical protein